MKKFAIASLMALVAFAASAVEVGVTAVDQTTPNPNRYGYGVTIGQNFGAYNVTAGISGFTREANDQTRYTLVGSREVYKAGPVSLTGRAGVAFLNNTTGADGSALTVGVGAGVPVAKNLTATLSVDRQYGQSRIDSFNGNVITAGLKYGF